MSKNLDWEKDSEVLDPNYGDNPYVGDISVGAEAAGTMKKAITEDIPDAAASALQSATLEWADNAIAGIDPELGKAYREYVERARERNPGITTITELLTPDLVDVATFGLGKLRKAHKAIKLLQGATGAAATDVVSQAGETGEYDGARTAMAAGLGGIGTAVKKLTPAASSLRRSYTGVDLKDVSRKAGVGALGAEDYAKSMLEKFDNKGLFKKGKVSFDPNSLSWGKEGPVTMTKVTDKAKSTFSPPSHKEMLERVEDAKKRIAQETNELVEGWSGTPRTENQMDMFPVKSGTTGVLDVLDLDETIEDILDTIPMNSESQVENIRKFMKFKLYNRAGDGGELSITDVHDLRKELDQHIKYDRNANSITPQKEQALRGLTQALREKVKEAVAGSGRLELLNENYADLSDLSRSLTDKVLKPKDAYAPKAGMLSGNIGYKLATVSEMFSDAFTGHAGQVKKTIENVPAIGGAMERGVRKMSPVMSNREKPLEPIDAPVQGNTREPQGQFNAMPASERISMNLPKEIMNTKIPRTSEGIKEYGRLFKLKIAQEAENIVRERMVKAGLDPDSEDPMAIQRAATELYKNVDTVVEEHPDELPSMLPVWIQQFPSMFEKDRYNRVDGVVPNSMQPLVREEIRKNPHISNVERIKQLDLLNRSGEYKEK